MKLSVNERLNLLSILPTVGDFTTLKIVRKLRESLSFSEEEHKKYNFRQEQEVVFWDKTNEEPKDVYTGGKASEIIKNVLKELNDGKKLSDGQFTLYEKFIEK